MSNEPRRLEEMFWQTVAQFPDRSAVVDGEAVWSYQALDRLAAAMARRLQAVGVQHGDRVGLWAPRSAACLAAMLGILKSGAAYVPADSEFPARRVTGMLADCEATALVCTAELRASLTDVRCPVVLLGNHAHDAAGLPSLAPVATRLDDLAYIIYTSGTTGTPKGVAISHRNIGYLVEAEAQVFGIRPEDRVFHGFSIAFDASLEEIWLAFRAGATLVIGSQAVVRSGPGLSAFLARMQVSVFSCVPTLLAMLEPDLPSVRLLIVGAEACPLELARRWARPGRRMVNTYGPTETTVVATWADLRPDMPVRIGRPLPGWTVHVVDEQLCPVPRGTAGELLIGGPGVAVGYLKRPDLTQQKFLHPAWSAERLYRSGDRVQMDADGLLEFLGRTDDQVKLRGFRVELGEIESVLLAYPGVASAAVTVHRAPETEELLAAYVTLRPGSACDEAGMRQALRRLLPPYMVPTTITVLSELPRLPGGKVDRRALPSPTGGQVDTTPPPPGLTTTQALVWSLWRQYFPGVPISLTDDFFDLGGHSLLATRLVSALRHHRVWQGVSVGEVYQYPTLAAFAQRLEDIARQDTQPHAEAAQAVPRAPAALPPASGDTPAARSRRHRWCGVAQVLALYPLLGFTMPLWLPLFTVWEILVEQGHEHQLFLTMLLGMSLVYLLLPVQLLLCLAVKWGLIGRYRPGRYKLWGWYYLRFWFVEQTLRLFPIAHLRGMPWINVFYRLMGAKIGRDVYLATDQLSAFDLLTIGDEASIGYDAMLCCHTLVDGWLVLAPITLGCRTSIGGRAWVGPGATIEEAGDLHTGAMLPPDVTLPTGQHWAGSPAQPTSTPPAAWPQTPPPRPRARGLLHLAYGLGLLSISVFPTVSIIPGAFLFGYVDTHYCDFTVGYADLWKLLAAAPLAAAVHVLTQSLLIAGAKRLLIGTFTAAVFPLHSLRHVRTWLTDALLHQSLELMFPLYATLYLNPWLRLLGTRLGKHVEVSTAEGFHPDLVDLHDGVFVADAVSLGVAEVRHGWMRLGSVTVGRHSFLGNSAIIPAGTTLPAQTLIGVLSMPPDDPQAAVSVDTAWLGIPAMRLPRYQASTAFGAAYTYQPSWTLTLARLVIEFFRVTLPGALMVLCVFLVFLVASDLLDAELVTDTAFLGLFPLLIGGAGMLAAALTILLKWVIIGRYSPQETPLWSTFVWRSELINALHEHLAMPLFGMFLLGTPLLPWYFRLLGAHMGRRCAMDSPYLTEFDLVHVGDDVALNRECDAQTHLFEDRIMKMSHVRIGNGCSIGSRSVVLYDAELGNGSVLLGNSLVMKGETIPPHTRWAGSPARALTGGTRCAPPYPMVSCPDQGAH